MLQSLIGSPNIKFRTCEDVRPGIMQACEAHPYVATYYNLGASEQGRPVDAVILGNGVRRISLIAGAHSDEPVGPETLRTFKFKGIEQKVKLNELFEKYEFVIVPHINPDGEVKNQPWIKEWPANPLLKP